MTPSCSSIHTGIFLDTDGSVKTCCSGRYTFGNLYETSLEDIFNSELFLKTKAEIEQHKPCEYCFNCDYQDSINPGGSQRVHFNKNWPSEGPHQVVKQIDIRWNNVCNLSCRYCSSGSSSEWAKIDGIPIQNTNRGYIQDIFETVQRNRESLDCIYLLGGEPLLQKHNERLLEMLSPETSINIVTNLSVKLDNNKIYQLLKKFPKVFWSISFETVGDRYEYVRQGASWTQFTENLARLRTECAHHFINMLPVYCLWSATNLVELYQFYERHTDMSIPQNWQLAMFTGYGNETIDYFKVFGHGPHTRELALAEAHRLLEVMPDVAATVSARQFFNNVIASLESDEKIDSFSEKFLVWTEDQERRLPPKKSFNELWPELHQALQRDA